ncbi:MAG: glycosyltransferase family A protein [Cyanobacteriota bacterium]
MLTILIPNWNRPEQLDKTLHSIYSSLSDQDNAQAVQVLVVDDYSTSSAVKKVVEKYSVHNNFRFVLQDIKCGNAEVAFLTSLSHVETKFLWLFGNDDYMHIDGISRVLKLLKSRDDVGMILLNPLIYSSKHDINFSPISTSSALVEYATCEELFENWGFVTSTTTFSCLIFRTDPIRRFHQEYKLTSYGTVYSHTFSCFCALRMLPGIFLSTPIVTFTLTDPIEEHHKLAKQVSSGVEFHHHTIGLSRLINACSDISGVPIRAILSSFEDEIDKDSLSVVPGTLLCFLSHFFLEQLIRELINNDAPSQSFGYLQPDEVELILATIYAASDQTVSYSIGNAMKLYKSSSITPDFKITLIRGIQSELRRYSSEARDFDPGVDCAQLLATVPLKLTAKPPRILPFKTNRTTL